METIKLQATHLSKSYKRRKVVNDVSFYVGPGEVVGLLGPNGAGKTTSFNMVMGLVQPNTGSVTLGKHTLTNLPLYKRARLGLGYLTQEPSIFRGLSIIDNFNVILERFGLSAKDRHIKVNELLDEYDLAHVADNMGSRLSGGERRRVEVARVLLSSPTHVLFDEPFAGIDPIAVSELQKIISKLRDKGIGVLITDHNVRETLHICDRAYLIAEGTIFLEGTPAEIANNVKAKEIYLGEEFKLN